MKKSYGVIALRMSNDKLQVLLIRRRESLAACDFLNSLTRLTPRYMARVAQGLTKDECDILLHTNVNTIIQAHIPSDEQLRLLSKKRQKRIRWRRDHMRRRITQLRCNTGLMKPLTRNYANMYLEPEWEFPKGRLLSHNEKQHDCAVREFSEETGIPQSHIIIYDKVFCTESYIGTNHVHYSHKYFYASVRPDSLPVFDPSQNPGQRYEISDTQWMDVDDNLIHLFRPHTAEIKMDCLRYMTRYAMVNKGGLMGTKRAPIGDRGEVNKAEFTNLLYTSTSIRPVVAATA